MCLTVKQVRRHKHLSKLSTNKKYRDCYRDSSELKYSSFFPIFNKFDDIYSKLECHKDSHAAKGEPTLGQ